jgi:hypothetical protein
MEIKDTRGIKIYSVVYAYEAPRTAVLGRSDERILKKQD